MSLHLFGVHGDYYNETRMWLVKRICCYSRGKNWCELINVAFSQNDNSVVCAGTGPFISMICDYWPYNVNHESVLSITKENAANYIYAVKRRHTMKVGVDCVFVQLIFPCENHYSDLNGHPSSSQIRSTTTNTIYQLKKFR